LKKKQYSLYSQVLYSEWSIQINVLLQANWGYNKVHQHRRLVGKRDGEQAGRLVGKRNEGTKEQRQRNKRTDRDG
jgi:hypothetical protein